MLMMTKVLSTRCVALLMLFVIGLSGCATTAQPEPVSVEPPLSTAELVAAGDRMERAGDLDGALVNYVKALSGDANNADLHYRVARVHAALGNPRVAQEAYSRALTLNPEHAAALEGYGLLLLKLGQTDAAQQVLLKAMEKNPVSWRITNGLGAIMDLKGNHIEAQAQFLTALKLKPNDPELLNNLGFSYYQSGDYDAAMTHLRRAIEISPKYPNAWSNLGLLHARRGEYERSVAAFEHIMDAPSARYSTAYVCIGNQKFADAERLLRAAIMTSPSYYVAAHTALKHVQAEQEARRAERLR